jgi:hypothetical protein
MTTPKAKKAALRLLRENLHNERSWRAISQEDYNGEIPAGTLCLFAKMRGAYLPQNERYLVLLGLKKERAPHVVANQSLHDMATATLKKLLENRQEMPPVDPRIVREFKKLGWLTRTR